MSETERRKFLMFASENFIQITLREFRVLIGRLKNKNVYISRHFDNFDCSYQSLYTANTNII